MKIKTEYRNEFEVHKLDFNNIVEFYTEGQGESVISFLTIYETIELIRFLETQVETFNNKRYEKI